MSLAAAAIEVPPDSQRRENDTALAIALHAGNPGAPEQAWRTFSPVVLRILRRYLGPGPDQQDLSQEVFSRLFTRMRELRDHGALRAFVVHISLGVAQNELRRRRTRRRMGLTETGELPDCPVVGADFEARQAISRCHRLLDCLGGDDRALFVRRHVEQMELAEVAAAFAWSLSKTKRRLARVTARVVRQMQHDPVLAEYAMCLRTANGGGLLRRPDC